jgi:hypothetical protein
MNRDWVDIHFNMVNFRVGIFRSNVNNFYFEPTNIYYDKLADGSDEGLQEATNMLANHLYITSPVIAVYEWGITMAEETAGQIESRGSTHSIVIPFKYLGNKYATGTILAHEISHAFLAEKGIALKDELENEMLTDISAVTFGLGKLTLNGLFAPIDSETQTSRLSYLDIDLMTYCYKKTALLRGVPLSVKTNYLLQSAANEVCT